MVLRTVFLLGGALACAAAHAQDTAGCAKFKWSVERERAAFDAPDLPVVQPPEPLPATKDAALVKLAPQGDVRFVLPPGRKPRVSPAFGGVLTLAPVAQAGLYQVTLSEDAWIDVIQHDKEVRSTTFSGQPDCPGVRKSVRFDLQSGPITIQISGAPQASVKVDILPAQ